MNLPRRVVPVIAATAVLLSGCGKDAASREELQSRARHLGFALDQVYVTSLPGHTRATGGLGVYGDDGFQDIYVHGSEFVKLTVERRSMTAADCAQIPLVGGTGAVTCEADGPSWYRTSGDRHEYAVPRGGLLVRLGGQAPGASRAVLHAAATGARPATEAEMTEMLPEARGPVERGDLPKNGDGAPVDPPHKGG